MPQMPTDHQLDAEAEEPPPLVGWMLRDIAHTWDLNDPPNTVGRSDRALLRDHLRTWAQEIDAAAKPERPSLPDGVEPVAWSDRWSAWVLFKVDVPAGWQWSTRPGRAWSAPIGASTTHIGDPIVLARPVPVTPEPATERVPWWEALRDGRFLQRPDGIAGVVAARWGNRPNRVPSVILGNGDEVTITADDGTVEVLAREETTDAG